MSFEEDTAGNRAKEEEVEEKNLEEKLIRHFEKLYGSFEGGKIYFAPGRVNLIGEHTDYNGGHVFPCALTIGTYAAVKVRADRKLRFYSLNFPEEGMYQASLDELKPGAEYGWSNYPKGVIHSFQKHGYQLPYGLDMLLYGNIPAGSGLSSSASLEVLMGYILKESFSLAIDRIGIALLGQESENQFNGVNCGIMDQFASAMGKKDHAIFLDTASLDDEYLPLHLGSVKLLISNTNKKHKLAGSAYNDRRRECEEALRELQKYKVIKSLGELSCEEFDRLSPYLSSPILRKRAKHAVYENQRTIKAKGFLEEGNLKAFGELMWEAHDSIRDDFEVSCKELDLLVEEAKKIDGCLGSRMTGGGFGGCTVSLVEEDAVEEFIERVGLAYREKIGYPASFYVLSAGDGPREMLRKDANGCKGV